MRAWKSLSLKAKSIISLGTVFVLMAGSIIFSISGAQKISYEFDKIIREDIKFKDDLKSLYAEMLMARRHEKDYLLRGKEKYIKRHADTIKKMRSTLNELKNNGNLLSDKNHVKLEKSIKNYEAGLKKAVKNISLEGDSKTGFRGELRSTAHKIETTIKDFNLGPEATVQLLMLRRHEKDYLLRRTEKYINKVTSKLETINKVSTELASEDAAVVGKKIKGLTTDYKNQFDSLYKNYNDQIAAIAAFRADIHAIEKISADYIEKMTLGVENKIKELVSFKEKMIYSMAIISGLGILILLAVVGYYIRLTAELDKISTVLKETSDKTAGISKELKGNADSLSSSVSEESAAILETVSTLDELKEMMNRSVSNAEFSEKKSSESHTIATDGKKAVSEVVSAINEISSCNVDITDQMEKTSKELSAIVEVIREISSKTDVINDIVFQTKLLSFNASVEAARAGEHGKGFAVVAEEVGNLAQMSGKAAQEIEDMITNSISRVDSIVNESNTAVGRLVDTAKNRTEHGVETAQKCNTVLDEVVSNVGQVKDLMKEISAAAGEQATGIENISAAMSELDQATNINTGIANTTADNSNQMDFETASLHKIVEKLNAIIRGNKDGKKIELDLKIKNAENGKVLKMSNHKPSRTNTSEDQVSKKNVVGSDVPDANDDRFEDV